jgi:hypothetical protein
LLRYGCPVDRLDTWLNAQRGWRLVLVRCVVLAPFGLVGGAMWSDEVTFDPATPQVRAMVARMALCTAASFLLAALTLLPPAWRSPARRPDRPWPTWRLIAYLYTFVAALLVAAYEQAEPETWGWHNHDRVLLLQLALVGVSLVMFVWNARYLSRLRRLRDHEVSPGNSPR